MSSTAAELVPRDHLPQHTQATRASTTMPLDLHSGEERNHDPGNGQFVQQVTIGLIDRILELPVGQPL